MSRPRSGPAATRLSRRRALALAATVGAGGAAVAVTGLSFAAENESASDESTGTESLVLSLRDAGTGTFDLFAGASRIEVTDAHLAAMLLKLVHG